MGQSRWEALQEAWTRARPRPEREREKTTTATKDDADDDHGDEDTRNQQLLSVLYIYPFNFLSQLSLGRSTITLLFQDKMRYGELM